MEQLLHTRYMHTKASDLVTTPPPRPTNAECAELLSGALALIKLFRGPRPFFKSPQNQAQWTELAQEAEEKLAGLKAELEERGMSLIQTRRELVWSQVVGTDHTRRPLTEVRRPPSLPVSSMTDLGRSSCATTPLDLWEMRVSRLSEKLLVRSSTFPQRLFSTIWSPPSTSA